MLWVLNQVSTIPNDQITLLSRNQPRVLRFFSIRLIRCRGTALHPHESRKQVGESGLIIAQFLWAILLCGSSPIIILHAVFHYACDRALLDCYLGLTNVNIFLPSKSNRRRRGYFSIGLVVALHTLRCGHLLGNFFALS